MQGKYHVISIYARIVATKLLQNYDITKIFGPKFHLMRYLYRFKADRPASWPRRRLLAGPLRRLLAAPFAASSRLVRCGIAATSPAFPPGPPPPRSPPLPPPPVRCVAALPQRPPPCKEKSQQNVKKSQPAVVQRHNPQQKKKRSFSPREAALFPSRSGPFPPAKHPFMP